MLWLFQSVSAAHHHHHHHHEGTVKSAHCSSEPRLTDNDISPGLRRRGSRRGQSMHHSHHRKSNAFLDVPDTSTQMPSREDGEDEDSYRLRSFSLTSKGKPVSVFSVIDLSSIFVLSVLRSSSSNSNYVDFVKQKNQRNYNR